MLHLKRLSGQRAGRLGRASACVVAGWVLSAPLPAAASGLPEPVGVAGQGSAMAPATAAFTDPSRHLPTSFTLTLPAISRLEAERPAFRSTDFVLSSPPGHRESDDFPATGFSGRLMARMRREALRYRRQNISDVAAVPERVFEDPDSEALKRRSHEASRIVTRSVRRALDVELERMARTSLGLGRTIDLLGSLSSRGARSKPPASAAHAPAAPSAATSGAAGDGWRGGIGMRLDAHPALLMRAEASRFSGRLEIPVRNEPIRLSVDYPLGPSGRAVLSSGLPRDGQGWATVMLNFSF